MADVLLYHIDSELSEMDGYYVRYSDDMLFIGPDYQKAMEVLVERLSAMEMKLNPKKQPTVGSSASSLSSLWMKRAVPKRRHPPMYSYRHPTCVMP